MNATRVKVLLHYASVITLFILAIRFAPVARPWNLPFVAMIVLSWVVGLAPIFIACPACGKSIFRRQGVPIIHLITPEKVCTRCGHAHFRPRDQGAEK